MTRGKGWFLAAALFATGALVGGLGVEAWHLLRGGPFGRFEKMGPVGFIVEHMSHDLRLNPDQKEKLRPIIAEMITKQEEARKPCNDAGEAVFDTYQAKVRALLNPDQVKLHDALVKRLKEQRVFLLPPPPPPGAHGSPPGPPPDGDGPLGPPPKQ